MNWYKKCAPLTAQIASTIATLLVNVSYGIAANTTERIGRIVAALPDEITLNEAIDQATRLSVYNTGQIVLTPEQNDIIQQIHQAFYAQSPEVAENKEQKDLADPAGMSSSVVPFEETYIGFIRK